MKKYHTGLVVGKFAPLHEGHMHLIETASLECDDVIILNYTTAQYGKYSNVSNRRLWMSFVDEVFENVTTYVLTDDIPEDSASEYQHRWFCAQTLLNSLETTVQAVYGSEEYVTEFAAYLEKYFSDQNIPVKVAPVVVDISRTKVPVSATKIRNNESLEYANEYVSQILSPKILILGGESSGKSVLANALATKLQATCIPEFGRLVYVMKNGNLMYEYMYEIAKTQRIIEQNFDMGLRICDTSPLTTAFFSQELFGRVSSKLGKLANESLSAYDVTYICKGDFPFVQDGTRKDKAFQEKAFDYYKRIYSKALILTGSVEERVATVVQDLTKRKII